MKSTLIKIEDIKIKFFVRTGINLENVKCLKDLYESNDPVNPIKVTILEDKTYELIDGRHRIEAAKEAGFSTIQAHVSKNLDDKTKILNAVKFNIGGALPPTLSDFEHSIELLINLKLSRKEILNSFPLPISITSKYYKQTIDKLYKRTIRQAVDEVLKGKISVDQACKDFKVSLKDLKWYINNKTTQKNDIDSLIKNISFAVRSLSLRASKETKIVIEKFEAGEINRNDVIRFAKHLKDTLKKLTNTIENSKSRLETVLKDLPRVIDKEKAISEMTSSLES